MPLKYFRKEPFTNTVPGVCVRGGQRGELILKDRQERQGTFSCFPDYLASHIRRPLKCFLCKVSKSFIISNPNLYYHLG